MENITSITSYKIKLSADIHSSNFDELKELILAKIEASKYDLKTDDDFHQASIDSKQFKLIETTLKKVKVNVLQQADELQKLFTEIDNVTESSRQARLYLDRQIKDRKAEIKDECIQSGIDQIEVLISKQSEEFKEHVDHSSFLDRDRFVYAIKGKAGIERSNEAIDQLCETIEKEITEKNEQILINKTKIDLLSEDHKVLFQDTKPLLNLAQNDLESEIEKRIKLHNEILAKKQAENSEPIASVEESDEQDVIGGLEVEEEPLTVEKNYRTIIKMLSTKDKAIELQNKIRVDDAYREFIEDITIENINQ